MAQKKKTSKNRKSKKTMKKRIKHHLFHTTKNTGMAIFMLLFAALGAYYVTQIQAQVGVPVEIRAKGDTGEERIELRIKDKTVESWTLTKEYKTYTSLHNETINDKDIKVAFVNDGRSSSNQDKNVTIDLIRVNGTTFQSENDTVLSTGTFSSGTGCADGYKQSERIHCSGYFQFAIGSAGVLKSNSSAVDIRVRAKGSTGQERVELRVKDQVVKSWVASRVYNTYSYTHNESVGDKDIKVAFVNDGRTSSNADKNLRIDYIEVNEERFQTEAANVFSTGTWNRETGCADGNKSSEWLQCNGYLQYSIGSSGLVAPPIEAPDPVEQPIEQPIEEPVEQPIEQPEEQPTETPENQTPDPTPEEPEPTQPTNTTSLVIRAQGSTGQERIDLRVNDQTVKSWTVSTAMQTYAYNYEGSVGGKDIKVAFVNDGRTSSNADKNVRIDYLEVDGERFQTEDGSVYSLGTYTRDNGCAGGNKKSEWLHCNGYMQYDIGGSSSGNTGSNTGSPSLGGSPLTGGNVGLATDCTLFVDDSGNDSRSGRSLDQAKARPNAAIAVAVPGDVICVAPGTYTGYASTTDYVVYFNNKDGTSGNPITLKGYDPSNRPVFVMNEIDRDAGACGIVCIRNSDYINVEDFEAKLAMKGLQVDSSRHVNIRGCKVHDLGQEAIHIGIGTDKAGIPSSNILVEGCEITNTGQRIGSQSGPGAVSYQALGELIYIGTGAGATDRTHNVTLRNNWLHDNYPATSEGIDVKPNTYNITIQDNLLENLDTWCAGAIMIYNGTTQTIVERNVIRNISASGVGGSGRSCSDAIGIRVGNTANSGGSTVNVRNNIVWDANKYGILKHSSAANIQNNTTFSNGRDYGGANVGSSNVSSDGSNGSTRYSSGDFRGPTSGTANSGCGVGSGFTIANYRNVGARFDVCGVGL
jgi:hypothetical protein